MALKVREATLFDKLICISLKIRLFYGSGIKFAIAVRAAGTFLAAKIDIFVNHFIDFKTQLLIDFFSDYFCVYK